MSLTPFMLIYINFFIQELNVTKGDKIAVILPNCVDYFYTQFGISKSGAVMVPINVLAKLDLLTHFLPRASCSREQDRL